MPLAAKDAASAHSTVLDPKYHGATNKSRTDAADLTVSSIDTSKEMIIRGRVYDVSDFIKRHPGGSIIKLSLGSDATDAYNNFHIRSKKADKMLRALPSRPVADGFARDALSADFEALRAQLEAEGYFEPNLWHVAYRVAEVVAMYWAGIRLIWAGYWFLGAIVAGIAQGRCGWLQHEGGHYSLTGNIKLDRHMQMIIYGLGCGMSGCYWRNQHNKHHATPQKLGADPDLQAGAARPRPPHASSPTPPRPLASPVCPPPPPPSPPQTMPLVAFHGLIGAKARGAGKSWLAWQAPLFFGGVITTLVSFGWQFVQHPKHALRVGSLPPSATPPSGEPCLSLLYPHPVLPPTR